MQSLIITLFKNNVKKYSLLVNKVFLSCYNNMLFFPLRIIKVYSLRTFEVPSCHVFVDFANICIQVTYITFRNRKLFQVNQPVTVIPFDIRFTAHLSEFGGVLDVILKI